MTTETGNSEKIVNKQKMGGVGLGSRERGGLETESRGPELDPHSGRPWSRQINYLVPRKRWGRVVPFNNTQKLPKVHRIRPDMTEKLFTWTLNLNTFNPTDVE